MNAAGLFISAISPPQDIHNLTSIFMSQARSKPAAADCGDLRLRQPQQTAKKKIVLSHKLVRPS
jgi:hypothetical protein